jgi:hypothetical protein
MSSVAELRQLAKTIGVRGYSVAKKADLIALIEKKQAGDQPSEVAVVKVEKPAKAPVKEVKEIKVEATATSPATTIKVEQEKPKSTRSNDWNNFLADYRKEHNVTLRQAMADAKPAYAAHKESKKTYTSPDCP